MPQLPLARRLSYAAGPLLLLFVLIVYTRDSETSFMLLPVTWSRNETSTHFSFLIPSHEKEDDAHPIVSLIAEANRDFEVFIQKETLDLSSAAQVYRTKRGRHPPPGFAAWWTYAKSHGVVMIEEVWDQMYHDLRPLWALDPNDMLRDVRAQRCVLRIRKGKTTPTCDQFWLPVWAEFVDSVAGGIPDLDLAMNQMDEPRLWIGWEEMGRLVEKEERERILRPVVEMSGNFSGSVEGNGSDVHEYHWDESGPIWTRIAKACPSDSQARLAPIQTDFTMPPTLNIGNALPHLTEGYISNYTLSMSLCHQPDLQGLHGFLVEPLSIASGDKLFPMFGSSKLTVNSEILIPAAMYIKGDDRFKQGKHVPWEEKYNSMIWRGLASGGRNKVDNWKGFHRHRLVSMLNGTQAIALPSDSGFVDIQNLPLDQWHLQVWNNTTAPRNEDMGKWLNTWADAGFNDLACFPRGDLSLLGCSYTDHLFRPSQHLTLSEQHQYKYLIDVDGNSFSGRYRDFITSASLPIKATIFREWHDSRLLAWKHFVPLDNRFLDVYGIMEFFLGSGVPESQKGRRTVKIRDAMAKKIALDGKDWAEKVLRIEDMRVYMYRLLLEYARVMDVRRDSLGYVDDLKI